MKAVFYNEQEAALLAKKVRQSLVLAIVFLSLAVIGFLLTVILSTYETKILWMVFGTVFCLITFCLSFLFFVQRKRRADGLLLYRKILSEEGETYEGRILSIKERPIVLANSFEVYPLEVGFGGDEKKILYLSSDKRKEFDYRADSVYSFKIVSLYIKEIEDA